MTSLKRRSLMAVALGTLAAPAVAKTTIASDLSWQLLSPWPKNSPGAGMAAKRLADRISTLSEGRLRVRLQTIQPVGATAELVDAVAQGRAEMAYIANDSLHTRLPASVFFSANPFAMNYEQNNTWMAQGGGQAFRDEVYASIGLAGFMAGNTGNGMAGWFNHKIKKPQDIEGLRYHIPGFAGEVLELLGAVWVDVSSNEIVSALRSGVIAGAGINHLSVEELMSHASVARYYYQSESSHSFGAVECLINQEKYESLPHPLRAVVRNACAAENAYSYAETRWRKAQLLQAMLKIQSPIVRIFPPKVENAMKIASKDLMSRAGGSNEISARIYRAYKSAYNILSI